MSGQESGAGGGVLRGPLVRGTRRLDHVGLSVPDLDEAVKFFSVCFGAEIMFRMERPAVPGPVGADRLGAAFEAQFALAMLSVGGGRLELLQWWSPGAGGSVPAVESLGGAHVAVEVVDVADALSGLSAVDGVSVLSGPVTFTEGPTPGLTNAFVRTPWGALVELVSWGLA